MKKTLITLAALGISAPAFAHHPLAGAPMETFAHGVLSGIGHPLLGFDHLFFIALLGLVALCTGHRYSAPLAYIVAMLAGTLLMASGVALPLIEPMIILSLIVLGAIVAFGRTISTPAMIGLFAFAGLFHGSAFGESIATQEAAVGGQVLIGYLLGLGITQYLIAIGAGWAASKLWAANSDASAIETRIAGAMVAGMGLFLGLELVEGIAFATFGLS